MIIFKVVNNKHNSLNECLNFEYNVLPNSLQCNFFFIILQALVRCTYQSYILDSSQFVLDSLIYPTFSRS